MRRSITWIAVACVVVIALVASLDTIRSPRSASPPHPSTSAATTTPATTETVTAAQPSPAGTTTGEDEECADATACIEEWSRAVAEAADFRLAENTGSAWVAVGRGQSFYIWATERVPPRWLEGEGYRIVRRVDGVPIFDDGIRLAWSLDRLTVWIEPGPTGDSVGPRPSELRRLVKASRTIAFDRG